MIELIERIETAEGASRELDAEIARRVGHPGTYRGEFMGWDVVGHAIYRPGPLLYTTSIDAAMKLVPDGCAIEMTWEPKAGFASMGLASTTCYFIGKAHGPSVTGEASTPALALCAAALRARSIDG